MFKSSQTRSGLTCGILVLMLSAVSCRLVWLQVIDRERYAETAGKSYQRKYVIQASRGILLDRNNEIIANTLISKSVAVDKYHLRDPRVTAVGLACRELRQDPEWRHWDEATRSRKIVIRARKIIEEHANDKDWIVREHLAYAVDEIARPLGMSREALLEKIAIDKKPNEKVIYKDLPTELAIRLEEMIKESRIQGFEFHEEKRRWYTAPELATHLIGYSNREGVGMAGIEKSMDEYLAGKNGYETQMRDTRGRLMLAQKGSVRPPNNGKNVQLTIDLGLQAICEEELDKGLTEFAAPRGTVILMDPHTGEVLAMASRPHYNLNNLENVAENGYNFGLQAIYEPGSTFKIVAVAAALNEKVVTPNTNIFCHNGHYQSGRIRVPDHHGYGNIPVWKVIQKSSNIGTYKIALMLGMEKFYQYASDLGFGVKSGIQLAGESGGMLRKTGNPTDFSRLSYGYAVSVTPLQIANAYCAIANGGKLMKPLVVRSIDTNSGLVIEEFKPQVVRQVMSEQTARQVREALATVVQKEGTALLADVPGFSEGGKTGTAVKHDPIKGGYLSGRYTVSFAGMLPAEDPAFVCVVVIDDPQTTKVKRYGGTIAAPIWREVAKRTAAHMNLTPTESVEEPVTRNL